MPPKRISEETQLRRAIEHLEQTIKSFPEEYATLFHPARNLFLAFLRGVVYGLGIIVAVALVVPLAILLVHQIQWVPLLGDFLTDVISRMEQVRMLR